MYRRTSVRSLAAEALRANFGARASAFRPEMTAGRAIDASRDSGASLASEARSNCRVTPGPEDVGRAQQNSIGRSGLTPGPASRSGPWGRAAGGSLSRRTPPTRRGLGPGRVTDKGCPDREWAPSHGLRSRYCSTGWSSRTQAPCTLIPIRAADPGSGAGRDVGPIPAPPVVGLAASARSPDWAPTGSPGLGHAHRKRQPGDWHRGHQPAS